MCGIVACIALGEKAQWDNKAVEAQIQGGLERIIHRGPDGMGIWSDDRCALGHCRLSINDLTPTGDQPLHSPDKALHAIVNGEIYYPPSSRQTLDYPFTGHSDSELVLALYKTYGLDFLRHVRGEFALLLFDSREDLVIVARDRYGIKPLFWRIEEGGGDGGVGGDAKEEGEGRRDEGIGGRVWFGAEIKAFLGTGWEAEWDVRAISSGGWGQDSRTLFKGVHKVPPGHYMMIRGGGRPEIKPYWDITYPSKDQPEPRTETQMVEELRDRLIDSVRHRLRADVPVGIYLSGGIDSSALAGIANYLVKSEGVSMGSEDGKEGICCFSIAFDAESGVDESSVAENTAKHLGVKYLTTHMDEQTLADNFALATWHVEHHNHDCNYIGKYVLSRLPRENGYKVVLTGEGADEQFGGYPLFLPDFLRGENEAGVGSDMEFGEKEGKVREAVDVVKRGYEMIGADTRYFDQPPPMGLSTPASMAAFTPSPNLFHTPPISPLQTIEANISEEVKRKMKEWHGLHKAQYVWQKGHLANQFLSCLGDRVEMAHSVEARTPFLDHHLTEYINHLPPTLKIRHTTSGGANRGSARGGDGENTEDGEVKRGEEVYVEKYALREAVRPFVTDEVYRRRKHAYTAPTTFPVGGPIHRLLEGLVTEGKVGKLGFVKWEEVQRLWGVAYDPAEVRGGEEDGGVGAKTWAWRQLVMVAQWVVLSEGFGVKRYDGADGL